MQCILCALVIIYCVACIRAALYDIKLDEKNMLNCVLPLQVCLIS